MEKQKIFVVSDIHGHCSILKEALKNAGFEKENEKHLLVCCGDYFDRGNENYETLKFFERLKHKVLLRGNHEDLLLKLLHTGKIQPHHYINGTMNTLEEFFGKYFVDPADDTIDFSGKTGTVDRICEFINGTVDYFQTENYVFVHGWLPQNCFTSNDLKNATKHQWSDARKIRWTEKYCDKRPLTDKTLVCGHMPTFYANMGDKSKNIYDIFYGNGLIAIDAGTADTKHINVLVLEDTLCESKKDI